MKATSLISVVGVALLVLAMTLRQAYSETVARPNAIVRIGTQSVNIPAPVGFIETSNLSKELWSEALVLGSGNARVIAHFVTQKKFAEYTAGRSVQFDNYLLVKTPKQTEAIVATQAQFDHLRASTVAMQSDLAKRVEPRLASELKRISTDLSSRQATTINVQIGEVVPVSIDRNESRLLTYTVLVQTRVNEGITSTSLTQIVSTGYCLVAGKLVMLAAYRQFHSPEDLQTARAQITSWASAVLEAN